MVSDNRRAIVFPLVHFSLVPSSRQIIDYPVERNLIIMIITVLISIVVSILSVEESVIVLHKVREKTVTTYAQLGP